MLAGCLDTPAGSPFWPRLTLSWVGGVGCGEEQLAPLLPNGAQLHHVVSLSLWVSPMGWIDHFLDEDLQAKADCHLQFHSLQE